MTEQDVAKSLTQKRLIDGIEQAEREMFGEYDELYADWSDVDSDVSVTRINELEQALVSLRVAKQIIEASEINNDTLQEIASGTPCDDATIEQIEQSVKTVHQEIN